jgi:hypothetical protein
MWWQREMSKRLMVHRITHASGNCGILQHNIDKGLERIAFNRFRILLL